MQRQVGGEIDRADWSEEDKIKARWLPIVEIMLQTITKTPSKSHEMPVWCRNIAERLARTVFKDIIALDPRDGFDAARLGRMIGVLLRLGDFATCEANQVSQRENIPDVEWSALDSIDTGLTEAVQHSAGHLANRTVEDRARFLAGVSEGFTIFLDSTGAFTGDHGRTNFYLRLLALWPEIARLQSARPPKSRRDLQTWLRVEAGVPVTDDSKWFDDVCDKIGLVMKPAGRPHRAARK